MSLQNDLRNDPECIEIEWGGQQRPFLLNMYGARRARDDMGIDFIAELLGVVRQLGQEWMRAAREKAAAQNGRAADEIPQDELQDVDVSWADVAMSLDVTTDEVLAIGAAVYAGFVSFDEDLDPKEVEMRMSVGKIAEVLPQIGPKLFSFMQDQVDDQSNAEEVTEEGKSQQSPR